VKTNGGNIHASSVRVLSLAALHQGERGKGSGVLRVVHSLYGI
jgi:hypothetical protein